MNKTRSDVWIKRKLKHRHSQDARIDVYISKDYMAAKADFYPAKPKGKPFTKEYLDSVMHTLGICYGVEYKALDDAADDCAGANAPVTGVIIARGAAPVDESPAYFKIHPALRASRVPQEREDGAIDFRAVTPYITVKAGAEIARLESAVAGRPGKTVAGGDVPFKTITRRPFTEGAGVYIQNDCIYAKTAGLLVIEDARVSVERVLRITGPVGYATGNIVFPGDLVLDGAVSDGFTVRSGGSITTRGAFTVSDCVSGGDLHVCGGLIGRAGGMIKVGGALSARFIWNCKIACKEDVRVARELINSTVWTLGGVDLGGKGCLSASDVYALRGMRAGSVGRRSARPAAIRLGTDWAAEREIAKDARTLRALEKRFTELNALLKTHANNPAYVTKLREAGLKIRAEHKKIQERILVKQKNLTVNTGAALTVYGTVYAGTLIEICSVRCVVAKDMRGVCFTLDAARRKIVPRPVSG